MIMSGLDAAVTVQYLFYCGFNVHVWVNVGIRVALQKDKLY